MFVIEPSGRLFVCLFVCFSAVPQNVGQLSRLLQNEEYVALALRNRFLCNFLLDLLWKR